MRIKLSNRRYYFTPTLPLTLVMCVVLAILIALGCWQLQRAQEKRIIQASYNARLNSQPLTMEQLISKADPRYYPVALVGSYDNAHNILLDNKTYHQQVGYEVLTPFLPVGTSKWLLVNRGWIPLGISRNQLPQIPAVNGQITLLGNIYLPSGKTFLLSRQQEKLSWPLRIQAVEFDQLAASLKRSLFPFIIQLNPKAQHGFIRDWQPVSMPSYKHVGYAVQWFLLALVLIILFIFLNIHKDNRHE